MKLEKLEKLEDLDDLMVLELLDDPVLLERVKVQEDLEPRSAVGPVESGKTTGLAAC